MEEELSEPEGGSMWRRKCNLSPPTSNVVHGPPSCSVHYMSASPSHASLLLLPVVVWIPKGHFSSFHCCVMLSVFVLYIILDFILYICSCSFICPLGARAMRAVHGAPHISFGANVVLEFPGFEPAT